MILKLIVYFLADTAYIINTRNCSVPLWLRAKIHAILLWRWDFCLAAEGFLTVSAVNAQTY